MDEVQASSVAPLPPSLRAEAEIQARRYVEGLLVHELQSPEFQTQRDHAVTLGQEEISQAAGLMQAHFARGPAAGLKEDAFLGIQTLRVQLESLNPAAEGDLLTPRRILGIIPWGSPLQGYFRKYALAAPQLKRSMQQIYAARDELQRQEVELDLCRSQLGDAVQKLRGAIHFAATLDQALCEQIERLRRVDPARAQCLEAEVLFYARQNLQDMQTQLWVCTHADLALEVLKKTGREVMAGCTRVVTTGVSALALAQTVARATGHQVQVMEMLHGAGASTGQQMADTGKQLRHHAEHTAQMARQPAWGVAQMQEMFNQTFQAMDAIEAFRHEALDVVSRNHAVIREQVARQGSGHRIAEVS